MTDLLELEEQLIEDIAGFANDPLGFVLYAFPWGEPGELEKFDGPDAWQRDILNDIKAGLPLDQAIREAVASGHGIGKSALVSMIILWAMSTMVDTKGVVTANTEAQLKTKTWSELAKWHRLSINKHWFELTATALYSVMPSHEKTWRIDMIPWSETRSEAFAGLHNKHRRVLLIFDEASAIADIIWEVAEGALTDEDTEIIWCCFGNPTRARGRFRDCFGRFADRWHKRQIDSRTVHMTNKKQLQEWVDDHGEDSDFVKVRVRGMFPSMDTNALLSPDEVAMAMKRRYTARDIDHAPKILGVDVARQGGDDTVLAQRQGLSIAPLKVTHIPDLMLVAQLVANTQSSWADVDATNVDATGGMGAGVVDKLRSLNRTCNEVYFSGKAADKQYFNKRSEMYMELAKWVRAGGSLPDDPFLRDELLATTYSFHNDQFRICEKDEIKEEIGRSPDRADAVALTFAVPVAKAARHLPGRKPRTLDYNPLD